MPFTVSYVSYKICTFSCIVVVTAILEAVPFSGENARVSRLGHRLDIRGHGAT